MIVGDISTNYLESTFNAGFLDIHLLWQFHVVQWLTIHWQVLDIQTIIQSIRTVFTMFQFHPARR